METFSKRLKAEITTLNPKVKNCCLYSFLYGMTYPLKAQKERYLVKTTFVENATFLNEKLKNLLNKKQEKYFVNSREILISSDVLRYSTFVEIQNNVFKCPHCREHFFKGLYFSVGTMNSPEKSYRLELVFSNETAASELKENIKEYSIDFNLSKRNNKTILYIKRFEMIENFLALMGAGKTSFELINLKINNEVRNIANRVTNCDSANINKSLRATQKYIFAINEIIRLGHFEELSKPLKEIAILRIENEDINLVELGKRLDPPVSKSGVHHRLEKILKFYENLK